MNHMMRYYVMRFELLKISSCGDVGPSCDGNACDKKYRDYVSNKMESPCAGSETVHRTLPPQLSSTSPQLLIFNNSNLITLFLII